MKDNNEEARINTENTDTEEDSAVSEKNDDAEETSAEPSVSGEESPKDKSTDAENDNTENIEDEESADLIDDGDDFDAPGEAGTDAAEPEEKVEEPHDAVREEKEAAKKRRKEKRAAFFKKAKLPTLIALIVIVCIAIALFLYGLSTISDEKIMKNTYIENLDVSGLTYKEAVDAINATYMFKDAKVTLLCGEKSFSMNAADIGLLAIPEDSAQRAYDFCRSGNLLIDGVNAVKVIFTKHVIMPAAKVDTEKLDGKINEFGNIVLGERKQHDVAIGDDNIATITSGKTGYDSDPSAAREAILAAFDNEQFQDIRVSFKTAPPDEMTLERFDAMVYKDPVDARYEIDGNTVNVVPEEKGRYINKEEAAPLLTGVFEGCEPVKIPFYSSDAAVTKQTLEEKLFSSTLASYSTSYGSSNSNRRANIARAASLINGSVLAPGAVFSFNDTVGRRTVSNGFYTAKEYVDGKSVDGIGGGTCQVSSTLYSAVLYADMSIVERLNHMMSVGYIPLGQDATVSDGGVDFKFKNSSDYPVKISAYTSGATVTISIIGTEWEPKREVKISNSTSQVGKNTVVRSTRYVYAGGELISTDSLNSSTYMPHSTDPPSAN